MIRVLKRTLLTISLFSFVALNVQAGESISKAGMSVGDKAPTFELETNKAQKMKYSENFKGKVLLVTLANYCNKDLAGVWTLPSYYKYAKKKDFAYPFVFSRKCVPFYVPNAFVYWSATNTVEQVSAPYLLMDWKEEVFAKYKVGKEDQPHIYVVDKKGVIRYKKILSTPFESKEEMEKIIENLLDE